MKTLIDTIKEIENILFSLENVLKEEHNHLLKSNTGSDILESIEKKTILFKKFSFLSQNRLSFEKDNNIFAPYKNHDKLNLYWNKIVKQCFLLRELNLKNKILINRKIHLNQYFLELFSLHKTSITYNMNKDLKI